MIATPQYQTKIYAEGVYHYICKSNPGVDNTTAKPVWQIVRLDDSGSKSYANSTTSFDKVADDYNTYTYN